MDPKDFSAERGLTIPELQALADAGAEPAKLLDAAGVPPEDVPAVLAEIARYAALAEAGLLPADFLAHVDRQRQRVEGLDAWLRSGDLAADWGIVMLPLDYSERERFAALRRILARLKGPPIDPQRWSANRVAFAAACEDLGVRVADLAEVRGWEAVRAAVGHLTPAQTADAGAMRTFHATLRRLVEEDLLGPGWRRHGSREAPDAGADTPAQEAAAAIEARATIDSLIENAGLTTGERAVLDLDLDGLETAEIAAALDTSEAAVRRRRSDAVKKLRSATK